ncbi:Piwi-domain-containing protein [Cylindrobasidium torrendii FP15055 ss-10]|uniref:Piwi-domain-containing protein n=1 Tax=Cylindrobasidium torrendii FP15055 ss-10 TaxID=1314674 RepID=A0A0D7B986_9AGAR|nr:Piwi-domain-containing protein [Cylindrobasidium torrendii FP15055 ss-10]
MSLSERYASLVSQRKPSTASVNAFDLSWDANKLNCRLTLNVVVITPLWKSRNPSKPITIGPQKAMDIMYHLQTEIHPRMFTSLYDGKKNLFTFHEIMDKRGIKTSMPFESGRPQGNMVEVVIRPVAQIHLGVVKRTVTGWMEGQTVASSDAIRTSAALNMLIMAVQAASRESSLVLSKGSSFYFAANGKSVRGSPFKLWSGFNQTVRITRGGLVMNVNTTVGVVIPKTSAIALAIDFLATSHIRDPSDLNRIDQYSPYFRPLNELFRVVKFNLTYGTDRRPKKVHKLIPRAGEVVFEDKNGNKTTVSEYFRRAYSLTVHPHELGILTKSKAVIPLSCLKVEQQLFNGQPSPDVIRKILEFIPQNPAARLAQIKEGWDTMGFESSEMLKSAGMTVSRAENPVQGSILVRPALSFGNNEQLGSGHDGKWDIMKRTLCVTTSLPSWCVVDFNRGDQSHQAVIGQFSKDLRNVMNERGIRCSDPMVFIGQNAQGNISRTLEECGRRAQSALIVAILPDNAPDLYVSVKRFGDVVQGVPTQCVRWSRKLSNNYNARSANQYHNNLVLKINAKLGGVNFAPMDASMEFFRQVPAMIIGADVSHPGPGSMFPSIASVVGSTDHTGARYTGKIRVQASRVEIIEDLGEMVKECLSDFQRINKALPKRIFFYRDGVSEGERAQVSQIEINQQLRAAFSAIYPPGVLPALTFIVVTKRHHIRFFPKPRDADRSQNCEAGFVVHDDKLTSPQYDDFYLQSQVGLKGTSVPGHYTILRDDIFLPFCGNNKHGAKKAIEQFTYTLCHTYARATRSVKIPAPVYYADLLCSRGKFHFDSIDQMSIDSNYTNVDWWKAQFKPLNAKMMNSAFWM